MTLTQERRIADTAIILLSALGFKGKLENKEDELKLTALLKNLVEVRDSELQIEGKYITNNEGERMKGAFYCHERPVIKGELLCAFEFEKIDLVSRKDFKSKHLKHWETMRAFPTSADDNMLMLVNFVCPAGYINSSNAHTWGHSTFPNGVPLVPNTMIRSEGDKYSVYSTKPIQADEELLFDYTVERFDETTKEKADKKRAKTNNKEKETNDMQVEEDNGDKEEHSDQGEGEEVNQEEEEEEEEGEKKEEEEENEEEDKEREVEQEKREEEEEEEEGEEKEEEEEEEEEKEKENED